MKKLLATLMVFVTAAATAQMPAPATAPAQRWKAPKKVMWKKPVQKLAIQPALQTRYLVYSYLDTTNPNAENFFPSVGNIGIGTKKPISALELRRNAGNGNNKNFLLTLSNEWASDGLNEPTIMFNNGDEGESFSYWTVGARVSGDNSHKNPQTFKIGFKGPKENDEHEYFSIDSYKGRVKIGYCNTNVDGYKLYVEEGILTEKVKVAVKDSEDWFDHVFNSDYKLMPLTDLEKYIVENKHLPDVPTTKEVLANGIDLGKTNGILLKKVEELTLYLIELKKDLEQTKRELAELKK